MLALLALLVGYGSVSALRTTHRSPTPVVVPAVAADEGVAPRDETGAHDDALRPPMADDNRLALRGVVRDSHRTPIALAEYWLDVGTQEPVRGMTADDGTFVVGVPEAGMYHLRVETDGFSAWERSVRVDRGTRIDIVMALPGEIAGSVIGASAAFAQRLRIDARATSDDAPSPGSVALDGNQRFRLSKVPAGTYDVRVLDGDDVLVARRGVVVAAGSSVELSLPLERIGAIDGTAQLPPGAAVSTAMLSLSNRSTNVSREWRVAIAADGTFHLDGIAAGSYAAYLRPERMVEREADATVDIVAAGRSTAKFVFPSGGIRGLLENVEGDPAVGDSIELRRVVVRDDGKFALDSSGSETLSTQADEKGVFEFTGLAAGRYSVTAQSASGPSVTTIVDVREDGVEYVGLRLQRGHEVDVEVTARGKPVAGATVFVVREPYSDAAHSGTTDERGRTTVASLLQGRYTVTAIADANGVLLTTSREFDVAPAGRDRQTIVIALEQRP